MVVAAKSEFPISSYQEKIYVPVLGCKLKCSERVDLKAKIDFSNNALMTAVRADFSKRWGVRVVNCYETKLFNPLNSIMYGFKVDVDIA